MTHGPAGPPRWVPMRGEWGITLLPPRPRGLRVSMAPQGCCPLPRLLQVPHRRQCHGQGGAKHSKGDTGLAGTGDTVWVQRGGGMPFEA